MLFCPDEDFWVAVVADSGTLTRQRLSYSRPQPRSKRVPQYIKCFTFTPTSHVTIPEVTYGSKTSRLLFQHFNDLRSARKCICSYCATPF